MKQCALKHLFTIASLSKFEDPVDMLIVALPRKLQEEIIQHINIYITGYNDAVVMANRNTRN